MGADRENVVPGNLCIMWKLNEGWPLKNDSVCGSFHRAAPFGEHLQNKKKIYFFLLYRGLNSSILNDILEKRKTYSSLQRKNKNILEFANKEKIPS